MEAFFSWMGAALGALFAVAVLVATWEHLVHSTRGRRPAPTPATPRAVTVDVALDTLTAPAPGDRAERQAALDGALARMAQAGAGGAATAATAGAGGAAGVDNGSPGDGGAWIETEPMALGAGAAPAAKPVSPA